MFLITPSDRNFYAILFMIALLAGIFFLLARNLIKNGFGIKSILNINSIFARNRFLLKSMDVVPEALVVTNETGKIKYVNDRAMLYFGWTSEEMMDEKLDLIIPEEYASDIDTFKMLHSHEKAERHLEIYVQRRDKSRFPVELTFRKWHDTENAANEFFIIAIRDISHRKKNEESVRIAREHLDKISTISSAGMVILKAGAWDWDMVEDVVYYDEGFRRLFGIKMGEVVRAKDLMEIVYYEDRPHINIAMIKGVETGVKYDEKYRVTQRDGTKDLVRCIGVPVKNKNGRVTRIEGSIILIQENVT